MRPPWDFDCRPVRTSAGDDDGEGADLVIATDELVEPSRIESALEPMAKGARAELLVSRRPIFWVRLRANAPLRRAEVVARLREVGVPLRYAASARRPDVACYPLRIRRTDAARPDPRWKARRPSAHAVEPSSPGRWFLRDDGGVAVDRELFGSGAGTRLAVIDNDAMEAERLALDAEILVHLERPPRAQAHGSLMVAWAVGAARGQGEAPFVGVAPDASPRLYCIPKPEVDVLSLPVAIVRAVFDGADVVVCAAYVEGSTSPMLDDALEVASRLGRRGRGTAVVLPTGREASSPPGSVHLSWSLGFGEPASDPRAFCIAPGARDGGWFLWSDRKGRLRPFGNRGPAVRWTAPGDDIAYPFAAPERLFHAESSGASAIAAGALLLVLAANRSLRLHELEAIVTATASPVAATCEAEALADRHDVLPAGRDADGHNAKVGYGRISAGRACLAARDPIAWTLVQIGETATARALEAAVRRGDFTLPYSRRLGRWLVRALLLEAGASHAARGIARHLRLVAASDDRRTAHAEGALVRQLELLIRRLRVRRQTPSIAAELEVLHAHLTHAAVGPSELRIAVETGAHRVAAALAEGWQPASAPRCHANVPALEIHRSPALRCGVPEPAAADPSTTRPI